MNVEDLTDPVSFSVENADDTGKIICRIKVNGKTIREDISTDKYDTCYAQASSADQPPPATTQPAETQPAAQTRDPQTTTNANLPSVVGMNLQQAQDTMQAAGFYLLRDRDATGQNRFQVNDRNWIVTRQEPPADQTLPISTVVTLWAKKIGE
ncbi:PASTA domain-containing protein [Acrocarpospora sp. B8E8]